MSERKEPKIGGQPYTVRRVQNVAPASRTVQSNTPNSPKSYIGGVPAQGAGVRRTNTGRKD